MSRTTGNLILLLALVLSLGSRARAENVSLTVSGAEQMLGSGAWDSGNITIVFGDTNGHAYTETVAYGQFSTPAAIASSLGAFFSRDYVSSGLCAHAVGSVLYFHLSGTGTLGSPTITNPSVSFIFTLTSWSVTPTVAWETPPSITYGTALSGTQLDATAWAPTPSGAQTTLPGTFAYSPATGIVPNAGSQTLSVTFTPTSNSVYTTATSNVILTVSQAMPTLGLATSGSSSASGASVTFTATVSSGPTGTVTFYDSGVSIGTGTISGTTATFSTTSLALGTHTITAGWPGNTNYAAVTSAPVVQNVGGPLQPPPGIIETVAGDGSYGYAGDGGLATGAELYSPGGVALDSSGNMYIADSPNNVIRMVSASTGLISTVVGTGAEGSLGDGRSAIGAELDEPMGIAFDSHGNLYIADMFNNKIRMVTASNGVITPNSIISTIAGTGVAGPGAASGIANQTDLIFPTGVALDASGNLYIADRDNNVVRKVTASNGLVTPGSQMTVVAGLVGNNTAGYNGDGIPAGTAELAFPWGVAVDPSGNLYIADTTNWRIREVAVSNGAVTPSSIITTVAGTGTEGFSGDTGLATSANLDWPVGVAFDKYGNLYIADLVNNRIRKVDAVSGVITANSNINTVAGSGERNYLGDGLPATASGPAPNDIVALNQPQSMALDASGNLYIVDTGNNVIREVGGGPTIPALAWTPPPPIPYGTALTSTQLSATANIAGAFAYTPAAGTVLPVGQQTLSVTFTPTDTADFSLLTASVSLFVDQATPTITWGAPAAISDATALSSTQLNATASTSGTFTYTPAAGTVLDPGPQLLTVVFTPSNTTNYASVTAYTTVDVTTGTVKDSGTVTLSVNTGSGFTVAASTNYSAGATTSSIAEGLAANVVSGAPVKVSAVDDQVSIVATTTGPATNYPYIIETSTWDLKVFSGPSFAYPPIEGALEGGSAGSSTQQTIYSVPSISYDAAGNLIGYTDATVMGAWTFNYDSLNRLSGGSAANQPVNPNPSYYCWNYDMYGNRWQQETSSAQFQSGSGGPSPCLPQASATVEPVLTSFNSSNNQITSSNARGVTTTPAYDSSGNMTSDGVNTYLYDAEDRICAVASTPVNGMTLLTGYIYNASGTRVSKGTIQAWSCDPTASGFTATNDYILGPGGVQLTEYAMNTVNGVSSMAWQHTNAWAAGSLVATFDSVEAHFYIDDWLGTRRVQTDYAGNVEQTCSSLPYGDGETCASTPTEHLFTGKERDAESGNDYFAARYYSSATGRFLNPDWSAKAEPVPYAKLEDPQSLNLYEYVRSNPLTHFDINGHCDSISTCFKTLLNSVQITISGGFTWGVSAQAGVAKGKLEASPLAAEAKSGLAGGDAEAKVKSEANASGNVGPLKAKVGAGGEVSTKGGASLKAELSGSAGPAEAKASASLDSSGAHSELSASADPSKSLDTDQKIAFGGKALIGLSISVDLTQAGEAVQGFWNLALQSQYSSAEPIAGPSVGSGGLTFPDNNNPAYWAPQ